MRCNPRGFYTVGKGKERTVHPICGKGMGMGAIAARVRRAERHAKEHGLKTGNIILVPKLHTFKEPIHTKIRPATPILRREKLGSIERKARRREGRKQSLVKGEAGLNLRTTSRISQRYPGRTMLILEQAQAAYHYQHPEADQTAEPYELQEGGFIDEALDSLGLRH